MNTNAVFVKRIIAKLAKASLIETTPGKLGGCALAKRPREITLLDVYRAVQAPRIFAIHEYPVNKGCVISSNINQVMGGVLQTAQSSFEKEMKTTTVADVLGKIKIADA